MKGIFRGIFIGLALLAGCGTRVWCATPEFVDSLRTELKFRNMPERVLFLPLALADQRFDDEREGIWSLSALDAIRGKALLPLSSEGSGVEAFSGRRFVTSAGSVTSTGGTIPDSIDVRFDERISTQIALDRLQELFDEYHDWDESIVAFATSPTALASMDSLSRAGAAILVSLRKAEKEYSENLPAAYERIGELAERRKAERLAFLREQAALRKARLDSIRKKQAERTDRISYTIRRGDTLGGIAARYHVKVSDLKRWNNLSGDMIREGRKLVIYR